MTAVDPPRPSPVKDGADALRVGEYARKQLFGLLIGSRVKYIFGDKKTLNIFTDDVSLFESDSHFWRF